MIVLGLTGSIGMGKSAAAGALRRLGLAVFDCDEQVHRMLAEAGSITLAVEKAFPGVTADGAVDRAALGKRVFADPAALKKLEAILHPAVRRAQAAFLAQCRGQGDRLAVVDIPLLFETGGEAVCDYVMLVSAPAAVQKRRVMARKGMTEARFAAILAAQMPDREKRRRADFVISTDQPLADTAKDIRALVERLRIKDLPG